MYVNQINMCTFETMKQPTKRTVPFTSRINESVLNEVLKKNTKSELRKKITKFVNRLVK